MEKENKMSLFIEEESGEYGVKQIAFTVAVIVVIGVAIGFINERFMETWIGQVWTMFINFIQTTFKVL
ncbi:hypothetical protein [Alkaliphilus transvaalensis]|uniref:hypothetical protein n=1 Tax=Alkaliphilus transvaalensis TaxID=114628 RepID=UPI00047C4393|nr:hypothetical protein [Alkaliphilus transvaalensis]